MRSRPRASPTGDAPVAGEVYAPTDPPTSPSPPTDTVDKSVIDERDEIGQPTRGRTVRSPGPLLLQMGWSHGAAKRHWSEPLKELQASRYVRSLGAGNSHRWTRTAARANVAYQPRASIIFSA